MTSHRRLWRSVAAGCCVISSLGVAACAARASRGMTPGYVRNRSVVLRVLQMNLCNSGIASCYTGRSVAEAARVMRAERPDIVTVNEVCRGDVVTLKRMLSGTEAGSVVISAFRPALEQHSSKPFRCRNGEQYGIGLLARIRPPYRGDTVSGSRYPAQDPADTEQRVWLCVHATAHFLACTTHLSSTSPQVAISQCRYLMHVAIPALRAHSRREPVILGADLNLTSSASPNAQSCVPHGFVSTNDGNRQYIVVSDSLRVSSSRTINMHGTTDHPGLLADLDANRRPVNAPAS